MIGLLFGGSKGEEYKKKFNIPEDHTPYHAIVLGYTKSRAIKDNPRNESNITYIK